MIILGPLARLGQRSINVASTLGLGIKKWIEIREDGATVEA
jgi:hypothetical protein